MDGDRPSPLTVALRWGRRHLAMLVALLAAAWVIAIVLWISLSPAGATGNPME